MSGSQGWLVGGGVNPGLAASPNLSSWRTVDSPMAARGPFTLASNGRIWVAATFFGFICTSVDGKNWRTPSTPADLGSITWVCWTGTVFVAVGRMSDTSHKVMTSPDGTNWTQRATPVDGTTANLSVVAGHGNTIVAGGNISSADITPTASDPRLIIYSTDAGVSWSEATITSFTNDPVEVLVPMLDCTVDPSPSPPSPAVTTGYTLAGSVIPDSGATTVEWEMAESSAQFRGRLTSDAQVLASGLSGLRDVNTGHVYGSAAWSDVSPPRGPVTFEWVDAFGDPADPEPFYVSYRIDFVPTSTVNALATDGAGVWVAGIDQVNPFTPTVLRSTDLITWHEITSTPLDIDVLGLAYGDGKFVAGGANQDRSIIVMTSPDGETWTARTTGSEDENLQFCQSVTFANDLFVACMALVPPVMKSVNGTAWTAIESDAIGSGGADIAGYGPLAIPQRQYPRDDGLGISTRRSWPPNESQQFGLRRGMVNTYL